MNKWNSRVWDSIARNNFDQLLSLLDNLEAELDEKSEEREYSGRIRTVVTNIKTRLLTSNTLLVGETTIRQLSDHSQNLLNQLQAFQSSSNIGHLAEGDREADHLLTVSAQMPPMLEGVTEGAAQEAAESFIREVSEVKGQLRNLSETISSESDRLVGLLAQVERNSQSHLSSLELGIQTHVSDFSQRVAEFQNQTSGHISRLDETISRINDQFSRDEDDRANDFRASQEARLTEFRALVEEQQVEGQRVISYLRETSEKAQQILGITAASVVAEAYLTEARSQKTQADKWRWGAVVTFVVAGLLGLALLLIWPGISGDGTLTGVTEFYITRITLVAGTVGLGIYLVRESGQHRKREHTNRRLANELTTFRPFLSEIGEEERNELVKQASERYFPGTRDSS